MVGSLYMSNSARTRVRAIATTNKTGAFALHIPADEFGPWVLVAKTKELAGRAKGVSTGAIGVRIDIR